MRKLFTQTILIYILSINVYAQNFERKPKIDDTKKLGSAIKSAEFTLQRSGETNTQSADLKWLPILTNKCLSHEPKEPNEELLEDIKREKTKNKFSKNANRTSGENSTLSVTPLIGTNYLGNENNGNSPMDNSIAISNGGWIVTVANTTIEVDDITGANTYYNDIATFFNDNTITNVCDPVVIYDSGADRFIFFAQECSGQSSNSNLLICFSKTNNPNNGWWTYKLTGNPLNNSKWFDYPKIAVSNNELYITGNLFSNNPGGVFDQALIYQIQKTNGYAGGSINWQFWSGISGSPFTLLPVSYGHYGNYGPGCFLVATNTSLPSSSIQFYDLTDDMSASNEQLNYYSIPTSAYTMAGNAAQLGTACLLDNGSCRALSGFYLNGIIHFVFHSDIGSGWNGINYNRLNVSAQTNQSSTFGAAGSFDYSYPSVVSYASLPTDASVMIGFGSSSPSVYPQMRVVNCDNSMNWSNSTIVKSSSSYVSYTSTSKERWGDYTGTTRKHNSTNPSIWMNGMFANASNTWDTWVAEIHANQVGINENKKEEEKLKVYPNPVFESFSIEFTLETTTPLTIEVKDVAGKVVKQLFAGKANQGLNHFSFNKANLAAGTYFLVISNPSSIIKNEKIIINN